MSYMKNNIVEEYTMNILFMIGNGFDLNLGLKTSYSDFYEYYKSLPSENIFIENLKNEISNEEICDWSDLELALGKYSSKVESEEEYKIVIKDISEKLGEYLLEENSNSRFSDNKEKIVANFFHFGDFFPMGITSMQVN